MLENLVVALIHTEVFLCTFKDRMWAYECKHYLSDISGSIFLSIHLSTDSSSPAPPPHHRVHWWRNLILVEL